MLDILYLSGSTLVYVLLFLPAVTIVSLAVLYVAFEAIQKFRRRGGI